MNDFIDVLLEIRLYILLTMIVSCMAGLYTIYISFVVRDIKEKLKNKY